MKKFQMAWRGTCLALFLMLVHAAPAGAQTTLGRVAGTVLDTSGAVLPGATITMTSDQTNQVQTAVSGETGAFLFPQVPVGTYKVEIALQGFKSATFTKVSVAVGQEYSLTARLELGNVSENVTVEAGVVARADDVAGSDDDRRAAADRVAAAERPQSDFARPAAGWRVEPRPHEHRHQRRPADVDAGDAGRHQHPGQLHPHELGRLRAEPADVGQRRRVLDRHDGPGRRQRGRRVAGADDHAVGHQPIQGQRLRVQSQLEVCREHVLQQELESAGQLPEPESVRRQRRRTGA